MEIQNKKSCIYEQSPLHHISREKKNEKEQNCSHCVNNDDTVRNTSQSSKGKSQKTNKKNYRSILK